VGYRLAAVFVVVAHMAYVAFVVVGGFLAWRWRRLLPWHVASVVTSAVLAVAGLDCPLTDAEKWLSRRLGGEPYAGGFIEHYFVEPVYPAGMTPGMRVGLRVFTVAVVVTAYAGVLVALRNRRREAVSRRGH
jgi:hypothetical protein